MDVELRLKKKMRDLAARFGIRRIGDWCEMKSTTCERRIAMSVELERAQRLRNEMCDLAMKLGIRRLAWRITNRERQEFLPFGEGKILVLTDSQERMIVIRVVDTDAIGTTVFKQAGSIDASPSVFRPGKWLKVYLAAGEEACQRQQVEDREWVRQRAEKMREAFTPIDDDWSLDDRRED